MGSEHRGWIALAAITLLAASCGSDGHADAQCLLSTREATTATGWSVSSAEPWNQEESGDGPACLYKAEGGERLNQFWHVASEAEIAETRRVQAENPAYFEDREDLGKGAFIGTNGIPSVFIPTPTGQLLVTQMLEGLDSKSAAEGLAVAAADRCCP